MCVCVCVTAHELQLLWHQACVPVHGNFQYHCCTTARTSSSVFSISENFVFHASVTFQITLKQFANFWYLRFSLLFPFYWGCVSPRGFDSHRCRIVRSGEGWCQANGIFSGPLRVLSVLSVQFIFSVASRDLRFKSILSFPVTHLSCVSILSMYFNLSVKAIKATVPFGLKPKKLPAISLFFLKVYTHAKKKLITSVVKTAKKLRIRISWAL